MGRKQTIFFVTNNYTPYSGGVVSSIDVAAHGLRARGHRVIIITLDFAHSSAMPDLYRVFCPVKFNYKSNPMAIPLGTASYIDSLVNRYKPTIIHTHHPFLLGPIALKVARQRSIPIAFTYHTLYKQYLHYLPFQFPFAEHVVEWLVQRFCRAVDGIVVPTETIKQSVIPSDLHAKVAVIPSGISPLYVQDGMPSKKTHKPWELLCVSRFALEKNLYFLLDMFAQLNYRDYRLILIGFGAEAENLKYYAFSTLKLPSHAIEFVIKPSKQELSAWYKRADIFVFSSRTETQGIVLAEALAHGTPVVALKGGGIVDIIKTGYNGFLVDDIDSMRNAIESLTACSKRLKEFQQAAWQSSWRYSPMHMAQCLELFYEQIMGGP